MIESGHSGEHAVGSEESRTVLKNGRLATSKDGRASALGNELKANYTNFYRTLKTRASLIVYF